MNVKRDSRALLALAALVLIPKVGLGQPEAPKDRTDESQIVEAAVMDKAAEASEKADSKWLKKAGELLEKYGGNDEVLERTELRRYLNDQAFRRINTDDSDDRLLFDEFHAAHLHCERPEDQETTWRCSTKIQDAHARYEEELDESDGSSLDAGHLAAQKDLWWFQRLEEQLSRHWDRLCAPPAATPCQPGTQEVAWYLWKESLRSERPKPDERRASIEKLVKGETVDDATGVDQPLMDRFFYDELFARADRDGNAHLDVLELASVFDFNRVLEEFADAAGKDFLLSEKELITVPDRLPNSDLAFFLVEHAAERTELLTGESPTVGQLARAFAQEELDALAAEKKESLKNARGRLVPDRGLVWGQTVKSKIDWEQPALSLRLIKDFTKAGSKASPANVTWDKERGGEDAFSVDAALRFDLYNPKWYDQSTWTFRPALGMQVNRSGTGDKKSRVDRYFLLGELFLHHGGGFLGSSTFQIGPVLEKDRIKGIEKLLGLVEWEPFLRFGKFPTAVRVPFSGDRRYSIYLQPKLAVELGEVRDQPADGTLEDQTFFRWECQVGLRLGRMEATYTYLQRHDVDDFDTEHQVQEGIVEWRLDDRGIVSLSGSWKKGEDSPTFENKETFKAGISVKI